MNIEQIVLDLCAYDDEQEWFEFKENWFQPEALGEYVSALSNAAAFHYKKYAYFVWGVNNETHEILGTTFNQYRDYNEEPYQNYLARNLSPSINFSFEEETIDGKRVGKAIHMWIRDNVSLTPEQKELLDLFIKTKYSKTNCCLK